MSPQESNNPLEASAPARAPAGTRRKAKPDIYTVLLVIALLAVILGIVFLWLYNNDYEYKLSGGPGAGMTGGHPSSLIAHLSPLSEHGCSRTC